MSLSEYLGKSLSAEHLDGIIGSEFSIGTIEGFDGFRAVMDRDVFEGLGEIESLEAAIMQFRPILATAPAKVLAQEVSAPQSRMEPPIPLSHPLRDQMLTVRVDESTARLNAIAMKAVNKLKGNDLVADARIQNAVNQAKAPKNWLDRAMQTAAKAQETDFTAAAIAPATEVAHPAFVRKAKEIQQGGFIGGEVGRKANQVVQQLKGRVAKVKQLVVQGAKASQNVKAGIESQVKKEVANIIVDRARIERFRFASVLKLYSLHKQALAKKDLSEIANGNATDRAKLVASAEQNMKLSKRTNEAFKSLMTKPLQIPGMSEVLKDLNAGTTDQQSFRRIAGIPKMFNTVSPPRSMVGSSTVKSPKVNLPGVVRTSWHVNPGVASVLAARAFGELGDFGYSFKEGWNDLTDAASSVYNAVTSDTARGIANVTGQAAMLAGPALVSFDGGATLAAGAGLVALSKIGVSGVKKVGSTKADLTAAASLRSDVRLHIPTSTSQKREQSVFFSIRMYNKQSSLGIELTENPQQAGVVLVRIVKPGPIPILGGKGLTTHGVKDSQFLEFELPSMKGITKYVILNEAGSVFMSADVPKLRDATSIWGKKPKIEAKEPRPERQYFKPPAPPVEPSFFEQHWGKMALGAGGLVVLTAAGLIAKKKGLFGELSPQEQAEQMAAQDGLEGLTSQQGKFKRAASSCKGRPGYRSCMSRQLKGR